MTGLQQLFVAETFPLTGRRLIEASAGTGKTYNIANLYLRLLLGDKNRAPLTIDQILVVTFTRAATSELRGRIREKIEEALQEYRKNDDAQAARLLNAALVCMDEAAIFTIHGFAVRVIQTFLFETGALADVELTEGDNAKKNLLMADVSRQLQMSNVPEMQDFFDALGFKKRDDFARYYSMLPAHAAVLPVFTVNASLPVSVVHFSQYMAGKRDVVLSERQSLKTRWLDCIAGVSEKQLKADISAIFDYPIPGKDKPQSSANRLITAIGEWVNADTLSLKIPGGDVATRIELFLAQPHTASLSVIVRDVLLHAQSCSVSESVVRQNGSRALLLQWLQVALSAIDLSAMQLDDVVRLINTKLQAGGESATALRQAITASYPVCMVDEFQDTDPEQFAMFNNLYAQADQAGFFMIGDPKQSIYAFRGADIFSYLGVRKAVAAEEIVSGEKNIYSLQTNFRSKKNLVTATNALFQEARFKEADKPTFVYPGIAYHPVDSCEDTHPDKNKGEYTINKGSLAGSASLVFVGNPESESKLNADSLRRQFALDAAQRIATLLNPASEATICKPDSAPETVQARDIAILVKSGTEARVMREALLKQSPAIGSVYQSQRDSVFSSALFAEDIYHILCAMDDPSSKSTLKATLATPLFRGLTNDFSVLDAIENDDDFFEQLIAEFSAYRQQWDQYGVLSSLNALMVKRELAQCFARQPDCDRLITDFRHLGELLQQYYLECGSREQLLIWYARQLHNDSDIDEDAKRIRLESDDNLVKIVTIHVSKGLEYPIVFLPFFFLPKQQDSAKKLPIYHDKNGLSEYKAVVDFSSDASIVDQHMQNESLAEDCRLLYVAVTRAVYQCYIGISASVHGREKRAVFPDTVWAYLLNIDNPLPLWSEVRAALQNKLAGCEHCVTYAELFDAKTTSNAAGNAVSAALNNKALVSSLKVPELNPSSWVITSYSALAQAKKDPGLRSGGNDELFLSANALEQDDVIESDQRWLSDIRYRLKGSNKTGDCLHALYEQIALDPARYLANAQELQWLVRDSLRRHGLEQPERQDMSRLSEAEQSAALAQRCSDVANWINATLDTNILEDALISLRDLFINQQALPELDFDFALGAVAPAQVSQGINRILQAIGVTGLQSAFMRELEGLMTGSMDLLFIHDKKVYVLDYKSNTLGKAPRFYNQQNMTEAMQHSRYDLQYLIYSVAAHRYMQQRLGDRYEFEAGEYSFGGVIYLFLRGMGLPDYPQHGIWFHKPEAQHILALDAAFNGGSGQ